MTITKALQKISFILFLGLIPAIGYSQCGSIAENNISQLSPYTHNGQLNSANLSSGKSVEFKMFFYKGLNYRLILATEKALGQGVYFKIHDESGDQVYTNIENLDEPWDFNVATSQELTIEIVAPNATTATTGCVAVLVGFRQQVANQLRNMR